MPLTTVKMFISSDMTELGPERKAVVEAISSMGKTPIFFETFPASPKTPIQRYREEVDEADVFIQLIGRGVSQPVREEYEAAYARIPGKILIFVKKGPHDLMASYHIGSMKSRHTYKEFQSIVELQQQVSDAIRGLEADAIRAYGTVDSEHGWEILLRDTFFTGIGDRQWTSAKLWLERGARVSGFIAGASPFKMFLLNEMDFADYMDGKPYDFLVKSGRRRRFALDSRVKKGAFYYLRLEMQAPSLGASIIQIELRKRAGKLGQ